MNADDYKQARQERGTQAAVAEMLGVSRVTVARRETGTLTITQEAKLALLSLPRRTGKSIGRR